MNIIQEWPTNTGIEWQDAGRKRLNILIQRYNEIECSRAHLALDIEAAKHDFASQDGASGWREEMDRMIESLSKET